MPEFSPRETAVALIQVRQKLEVLGCNACGVRLSVQRRFCAGGAVKREAAVREPPTYEGSGSEPDPDTPRSTGKRGPAPKLQQQLERITRLPKAQQRFVMQMIDTVLQQQASR
jgi:hypothetical protein